jgi:hypothetical protein
MSTDQELLAEVRAVLGAEVADVTAGPALLAAVRRAHARRVTRLRVVFATAAAVVLVLAGTALWPDARPAPRHEPRSLPEPANAAYVRERTSDALNGLGDNVIYERAVVTKGDKYSEPGQAALYERWLAADGSSFRLLVTIDGRPVVDLSRDRVADVFVDYRTHTYHAFPGVEPSDPKYDDVLTPDEIRQGLADGRITVAGPATVNGKAAVKLHYEGSKVSPSMDLWVDATTYLPVRWQWLQESSTPFDVTWLPPTPANIEELTTEIPDGFAKEN